jgi:hypothetical protein
MKNVPWRDHDKKVNTFAGKVKKPIKIKDMF